MPEIIVEVPEDDCTECKFYDSGDQYCIAFECFVRLYSHNFERKPCQQCLDARDEAANRIE